MIQKLTLFSQEVEDFVLEIKINSDSTFLDLHKLILEACGYKDCGTHSFLICDEEWRVRDHIHQAYSGNAYEDEDVVLMHETSLTDYLEDEGQRLAYLFSPDEKRFFLMELTENIFNAQVDKPLVSRRHGQAPLQHEGDETAETVPDVRTTDLGEEFYGDSGFAEDEMDREGFEISE